MISSTVAARLLLVPGFMQRGSAWAAVAEQLGERYPSAALDHREHTYEGRLDEIRQAGEAAVLVGYSLGGRLCLHAALREPGGYRALVTIGASAGIEDGAERTARRDADERLATWMETRPIEDIVAVWERQPLFADQSDPLLDEQRPARLSHDPAQLATLLRTAGQGVLAPVWTQLPGLDLPFLAVAGARDERYLAAARRMAEAVPRGSWDLVEHAGHAPQLQQPEATALVLARFLDRLG